MPTYEALRQRHVAGAMPKIRELVERIDWPAGKLTDHRQAELRRLLRTAQAASPWHRKRLTGVDVDTLDERALADLPVMTKDDLMENFNEIVTDDRLRLDVVEAHLSRLGQRDAYLFDRYHACASGGSCGRRGVLVYDWDAWTLVYFGIIRRLMRSLMAAPPQPGPPRLAMVAAGNATHMTSSTAQTFSTPSLRSRLFPVTDPVEGIVAGLNDYQPTVLVGYPSVLHRLTRETAAGRLRVAPRFVVTSAEPLLPEARQALEETWGVPALNYYATSETGALGNSCGHGPGLHLADDLVIVEPVDEHGRPVAAGERSARILVTNLFNHTLPLIRYEITDEVTLLDQRCGCGSAQRLVADPQGRFDDLFRYGESRNGGLVVHPHVFRSPLGRHRAIVEYQVCQTPRGADVAVRCDGPVDLAALQAELAGGLARVGLPSPEVSVGAVDRIERHRETGKLRRFVPRGQDRAS